MIRYWYEYTLNTKHNISQRINIAIEYSFHSNRTGDWEFMINIIVNYIISYKILSPPFNYTHRKKWGNVFQILCTTYTTSLHASIYPLVLLVFSLCLHSSSNTASNLTRMLQVSSCFKTIPGNKNFHHVT